MIHIFVGTKAQLIKMAPIMADLQEKKIEFNFIFSGQHKDTTNEILENFNLKKPDICLYDGPEANSIGRVALWMIKTFFVALRNKEKIWKNDRNGIVLNHGDTFSTLLGSLLGKLAGLKCAHIESGLRSNNLLNPFPEEITRVCVFFLSDYYFAPGKWALNNLTKFRGKKIDTQTNTLIDAIRIIKNQTPSRELNIPDAKFFIASFHRFENIFNKKRLTSIIEIIEELSMKTKILVIMHSPTEKRLKHYHLFDRLEKNQNIELRPRYDYLDFNHLLIRCDLVLTDGGSNQEECHYLGIPCVLLRSHTEREDGLNDSTILSNFDLNKITSFIAMHSKIKKDIPQHSPSSLIVETLNEYQ